MADPGTKEMVLEYMEKGYLENIVDMFRHDAALVPLVVDMIADERMRVRLGAMALVEELAQAMPGPLTSLIPGIAALLGNPSPTVRGDAAYMLSLIKGKEALPYLESAKDDPDAAVREVVRDAIADLRGVTAS